MNFKKIITTAATFAVMFSVTLAPAANNEATRLAPATISASAAGKTLADLRNQYKDGLYWNHAPNSKNDPSKCSTKKCAHHKTNQKDCAKYDGNCGCNATPNMNIQCMGFADQLAHEIYGSYAHEKDPKCKKAFSHFPKYELTESEYKNIKRGDVVRDETLSHSFMIIDVYNSYVKVVECNSDYLTCQIKWDSKYNKSKLINDECYLYKAPYPAQLSKDDSSDNKLTQEIKPALGTVWVSGDTYNFNTPQIRYKKYSNGTLSEPKDNTKVRSSKIMKFYSKNNSRDTVGLTSDGYYVLLRRNDKLYVNAHIYANDPTGVNYRYTANGTYKNTFAYDTRLEVTEYKHTSKGIWANVYCKKTGETGWVSLNICRG